jgi:hypothetical protein
MPPAPPTKLPFLRRTAATAVLLLGGAALADAGAGCRRVEEAKPSAEASAAAETATGSAADILAAPGTTVGPAADATPPADAALESSERIEEATAAPDAASASDAAAVETGSGEETAAESDGEQADASAARNAENAALLALLQEDPPDDAFGVGGIGRPYGVPMATGGGAAPDLPLGIVGLDYAESVPAFDVGVTVDDVRGSLDASLVQRELRRRSDRFRSCAQSVAGEGQNPVGRVRALFTVSADGTVAQAQVVQSTVSSVNLPSCVLARLRTLGFPSSDDLTTIEVSFVFEAPD